MRFKALPGGSADDAGNAFVSALVILKAAVDVVLHNNADLLRPHACALVSLHRGGGFSLVIARAAGHSPSIER